MEEYIVCGWDNEIGAFSRPMTEEEIAQVQADRVAAAVLPVPKKVTRRQARQALLLRGYLDQVPVAIAAIPDVMQRRLAEIEWEDSQEFERHRPLVISIGTAMGMDLDELFIFAGTL